MINFSTLSTRAWVIRIGIVAALIVLGIFLILQAHKEEQTPEIPIPVESVIGQLPPMIEIADTAEKRTQGLSGRPVLEDDYGMLFVFPEDGRHGFWMKDMRVAIDIVWIDARGEVVHIEHGLAPDTYPDVFTPPAAARYVLETRAGYAKDHGWEIGTLLDLSSYK